jgi:hypothetical protein
MQTRAAPPDPTGRQYGSIHLPTGQIEPACEMKRLGLRVLKEKNYLPVESYTKSSLKLVKVFYQKERPGTGPGRLFSEE